MVARLIKVLRRDGLSFLIVRLIANILRVEIGIQRAKNKAWAILKERYSFVIAHGPFKGMLLAEDVWWSGNDRITQTLGVYEEHVLKKLRLFSGQGAKRFIDIGAADGYFAVGMAYAKIYSEVYAFEIDLKGQEKIKENAIRNSCSDAVQVFGEANIALLSGLLSSENRSSILIDIEGAEYNFLNNQMLSVLKDNYIICELHPWVVENGKERQALLLERASKNFDIELIIRESYSPNLFPELDDLSDEERLIAVGEGRGRNMQWLVLTPKCQQ